MENVSSSNSHKELVPKLRFASFKDSWVENELQNIFAKISQKNTSGDINNVICNSAQKGLIPQREYFDKDIANIENTNGYFVIKKGDFVYNPRKSVTAPYGPVSAYNYSDDGIVSPLYLCFRAKETINTNFYEWYFKSSAWHRYIYLYGDSGVRHDRVSIKDSTFFEMPLHIPCNAEQEKLAQFLSLFDSSIQKQQQLIDSLKSYKRGVLQSINVPTKTYCVGQIFNITRGYVLPTSNVAERKSSSNCYPVYSSQTKNDGLMGYFNQYLYENAITWTTDGANAGYTRYRDGKFYCTNVCGVLLNDDGYANEFVAAKINEISKKYVSYVGNPKLMNNVMAEIKVDLPDIEKQQYYSKLIDLLNRMIDYNSKILENLADIKLSFLQQLFI